MPELFDTHNSGSQGTSQHSYLTYKETKAQEGDYFLKVTWLLAALGLETNAPGLQYLECWEF